MSDVVDLIGCICTTDEYGDKVTAETSRTVFCEVKSVGGREFYQAHAVGLKPEIVFVLADYLDYQGEKIAEYAGARYHVLRTYRSGQQLEITCYTEVNQ